MNFTKDLVLAIPKKVKVVYEVEESISKDETFTKRNEGLMDADHLRLVEYINEPRKKRLTVSFQLGKYVGSEWLASDEIQRVIFNGKGYLLQEFSKNPSEVEILKSLMVVFQNSAIQDRRE